jgi:hypothetical protein
MSNRLADRDGWRRPDYSFLLILPGLIVYALWAWVIFRIADDELLCLDALRQGPVPPGSAGDVHGTIDAAITLLIILPAMAIPLLWLITFLRETIKTSALRRGPAYLDDEIELCIATEPDYRYIPGKVNIAHSTNARMAEASRQGASVESLRAPLGTRFKAMVFWFPPAVRRINPWLGVRRPPRPGRLK